MDLIPIIERYLPAFRARYAGRITPAQESALHAMLGCRTEQYAEILLHCSACDLPQSRFQSCGHRSCHRCQHHDTTRWLERQRQKLLPVEYFMVTFTLPRQLRSLAWHHQKDLYSLLFECAVSTLKDFGMNDKTLAADLGMTAVLHTHTRRLDYHPHLHIVVPGGGFNKKRRQWKKCRGKFLFNEFALAKVFRGRFLAALRDAGYALPPNTPTRWVANCKSVGKGLPALEYLSRYLYRGVISENNIIDDNGSHVTFRYTDSSSGLIKPRTVTGEVFLWLLLQHVLPKGFRRVRDYGFLHGNAKSLLQKIQLLLRVVILHPPKKDRPSFKCCRCKQPVSMIGIRTPAGRSG